MAKAYSLDAVQELNDRVSTLQQALQNLKANPPKLSISEKLWGTKTQTYLKAIEDAKIALGQAWQEADEAKKSYEAAHPSALQALFGLGKVAVGAVKSVGGASAVVDCLSNKRAKDAKFGAEVGIEGGKLAYSGAGVLAAYGLNAFTSLGSLAVGAVVGTASLASSAVVGTVGFASSAAIATASGVGSACSLVSAPVGRLLKKSPSATPSVSTTEPVESAAASDAQAPSSTPPPALEPDAVSNADASESPVASYASAAACVEPAPTAALSTPQESATASPPSIPEQKKGWEISLWPFSSKLAAPIASAVAPESSAASIESAPALQESAAASASSSASEDLVGKVEEDVNDFKAIALDGGKKAYLFLIHNHKTTEITVKLYGSGKSLKHIDAPVIRKVECEKTINCTFADIQNIQSLENAPKELQEFIEGVLSIEEGSPSSASYDHDNFANHEINFAGDINESDTE